MAEDIKTFSVKISARAKARLVEMAAHYEMTQNQALTLILEHVTPEQVNAALEKKAHEEAMAYLRTLSPEERRKLLEENAS